MLRFISFIFLIFLSTCGSPEKKVSNQTLSSKEQAVEVYKEGLAALERSDYFFAAKKFGEAEILLPQSDWASKSALMIGYCFYSINFYEDAILNLERFAKTYPASENLSYANYLIAISYYEQILSEEKDIEPLLKSKDKIEFFLKKYPDTDYAIDLGYKLELVINQLAAKGVEVHVFANEWHKPALDKIHIHSVPTQTTNATQRVLSFSRSVKEIISRENFDIIQSHERTVCQDIYRAGDGCHKEWLVKRKQYNPIKGWFLFLNPFHREVLKIEKQIFTPGNYKKIIAISGMVKKDIQTHYQVPEQDIEIIYNGVSLDRFHPRNKSKYFQNTREKWGIPNTALTILTIGSGFERKGLKFLMHSLKYFDAPEWRLIVIGKGNWKRYAGYSPRKFRDRLIHLSPPLENLEQFYAASDIFVLPSIYEPFGNVHLEALASGLPTIASRFSGVAELINHKHNGMILQDPSNPEEIASHINFLTDKGYHIILSVWKPIISYGGAHRWQQFVLSDFESISKETWGNIIAINEDKLYHDFIKFSKSLSRFWFLNLYYYIRKIIS